MKFCCLVERYIDYRRSLGERCETNAIILRAFCHTLHRGIAIKDVRVRQTTRFLYGNRPVTSAWHIRYNALKGFFRYALSRDYTTNIPLPDIVPQRPPPFIPFIYTRKEVRDLLNATETYQRNRSCMEPRTVRVIILLLYATGLRASEALRLNRADVDLNRLVLTVRESKFFKSRFVPFSVSLRQVLQDYLKRSAALHLLDTPNAPFFTTRRGDRVNRDTLESTFRRVCRRAGIRREQEARYQPRLHDLRHTFAVHRLTSWYRQGRDVQLLLPQLSVYLGHVHLAATQTYLTMTPEVLNEANQRFEKYVEQKLSPAQ